MTTKTIQNKHEDFVNLSTNDLVGHMIVSNIQFNEYAAF